MAQFARPDSDVATGGWSTTPLWSKVDSGVASPDDVDITSADNSSPDNADFTLTDVTDPASSSNHIIRALWRKSASGGHAINAVLELWQGVPDTGTLIATLSVTGISEVEQTSTYTLTGTEADNITDYAALHFRLSRQGDQGGPPGNRRSLVVDEIEFEVPDANTDRRARVSAYELEVPLAPRRARVSAFEQEVPDAPRRARVSAYELEAPLAPRRARVSAFETETPSGPNEVTDPSAFDSVNWNQSAIVTADDATAPDGTVSGDLLEDGSSTAAHNVNQDIADQAGTYFVSVWLKKKASGPTAQLRFRTWDGGAFAFADIFVNPDDGAFAVSGDAANGKVSDEGDWWKVSFETSTPHVTGSGNPPRIVVYPAVNTGGTLSHDATVTGSNHFWTAEAVLVPASRARVSAFEFETPDAPRRARVSAFEFEVPTAPRRARVSAFEFEMPDAPRRARVSAFEFETPDAPRRARVSAFEFEVPNADRRARVSAFEFETPDAPRRARVSAFEFETPDADRRARVSAFEFEVPTAPRRARISAYEFETPDAPRRARVSAFEFEVPNANRRARVSAFEFEVPTAPRRARISAYEFEVTDAPRRARVSAFELQLPDEPGAGGVQPPPQMTIRMGIRIG